MTEVYLFDISNIVAALAGSLGIFLGFSYLEYVKVIMEKLEEKLRFGTK